jgi:hypothetical protein
MHPGYHLASSSTIQSGAVHNSAKTPATAAPPRMGAKVRILVTALRCAGLGWLDAELGPFDFVAPDGIPDRTFALGQAGAARLDFEEDDPLNATGRQPIEHNQIDGAAEKADVLRVIGKYRQIGDQLLVNLAGGYRPASLHSVFTDTPGILRFPELDVTPCQEEADGDSDGEPIGIRWHGSLTGKSSCVRTMDVLLHEAQPTLARLYIARQARKTSR